MRCAVQLQYSALLLQLARIIYGYIADWVLIVCLMLCMVILLMCVCYITLQGQFKQSIAFSRVCTGQAFCKPFTGLPKAWIVR
jgi:hypothetical protein